MWPFTGFTIRQPKPTTWVESRDSMLAGLEDELTARRSHTEDLTRHDLPTPRGPEGEDMILSQDAAGDGLSPDGQSDKLYLLLQGEIILCRLRALKDRDRG